MKAPNTKTVLAALCALPLSALAATPVSVSVTYVPLAAGASTSSVPTLTEWAMVALSLFIAAYAIRQIKAKGVSKGLLSALLATTLFGATISDGHFVSVANAIVPVAFDTPAGNTFSATTFPNNPSGVVFTTNDITNTSGVTVKITAETGAGTCFGSFDAGTNTCAVNSTIVPGASCKVGYVNAC